MPKDIPGYGSVPRQCMRCHRYIGEDRHMPHPGKRVIASHGLCERCEFFQNRENLQHMQLRHPTLHIHIPDESEAPPDTGRVSGETYDDE